ncbi:hypothetical protein AB3S75_018067 [Citrus x aurantiifolia]
MAGKRKTPCCSKGEGLNRGAWKAVEDKILTDYIKAHGEGKWRHIPKAAGLKRCGKSCRLRWMNYLRPDIKRGNFSKDEEDLIIRLHKLLGNSRWALIAGRLPGRTDNDIKNYWNTKLSRRVDANHHHHQNRSKVEKKPKTRSSSGVVPRCQYKKTEKHDAAGGVADDDDDREAPILFDYVPVQSQCSFGCKEEKSSGSDREYTVDFDVGGKSLLDLLHADLNNLDDFGHDIYNNRDNHIIQGSLQSDLGFW